MEEIAQTLQASLSPDTNTRVAAELRLSKLFTQPETGLALASLTVAQQADPTIRQSAGVVLRKYITEHWSPFFSQFRGSAPPVEIKQQIRQTIFQGLSDPNRKIRTTSAYIVSTVASSDWPDEYPDLLNNLVAALAISPDAVHGTLQVFTEFMKNDLTEDQLVPVLNQVMPALHNILGQPQVHSPATRARTIIVFRQCVVSLVILKDQHQAIIKEATDRLLPAWLDAFKVLLEVDPRLDVADESNWDALAVKIQIFKSLNTIVASFPKYLEPHVNAFVSAAVTHLVALAPVYAKYYLSADGPNPPVSEEDPEGITVQALVAPLTDFLSSIVRKGRLNEWLAHPEHVQALVSSAVLWAQITTEDEGKWEDNPNSFVAEDDDVVNADNLRAASFELISACLPLHLIEKAPVPTLAALQTTATSIVADSDAQKQQGNTIWWKHLESLLAVLSAAAEDILEDHSDKFEFGRFVSEVIPNLLTLHDTPFLAGRAFVLASRLASVLPAQLLQQYLSAAASVLESGGGVVIKISAVKAIRNFCDKAKDPSVVAFAPQLVKNLGPFLAASEDTLSLIVETLVTVLELEDGRWLTPELTAMLSSALLDVWAKNVRDPILLSVLEDAFQGLAKGQYQAAAATCLPRLSATLGSFQPAESWVAGSAIQIIVALFRGAPADGGLGEGVVAQLAPVLFAVLERTDDRDVLQNGIICITLILRKDSAQFIAYPDGLGLVLRLIARTLAPTDSESAGQYVGDLILTLLRRAGTAMLPAMQELLNALLNRLPTAKTATFIQSLILPFAYLIYTQRDAVLEMLETTRLQDGRSGLQVLLESWCENGETFVGFKAQRLSNLALSTLFASERPSVQSINVKGDLIVKPETSNVIMTRSRAKQIPHEFTVIPFPVKALKLLLHDLQLGGDAAAITAASAGLADSDDDDEWEDEDKTGEGAWLSDLLGPGANGFEDDDVVSDDDDDFRDDPISQIDMKACFAIPSPLALALTALQAHILSFLKECAQRNTNNFSAIVDQLKAEEIVVVRAAVQS
ncbi:ARM repeat-containing protein [Auricularia subglabra TFB-10046 SS5]|nr:ARM repeat-containing protein [Auricularia subglabra TFB-10046 SS5]